MMANSGAYESSVIRVRTETRTRLEKVSRDGESFDKTIQRLLEIVEIPPALIYKR